MAIQFNTFKDEDLTSGFLKAGEVSFRITAAEEKTNKYGKPYLGLTLYCYNVDGSGEGSVFANLGFSEKSRWKLAEFFKAIGEEKIYQETGIVDGLTLLNKSGYCLLEIGKPQKNGKTYLEVKSYIVKEKIDSPDPELNDDIPF